tara:strand:+ start:914 stop:1381 length:468 start_codon:yes stop_codon:yes gene_type:complete
MMTIKFIDGQIRKMETKSESKVFFDFEFWAESDEETYGLLCLIQRSKPINIFITEMNSNELAISRDAQGLEAVKSRVAKETGVMDLVFPKVVRFDEKKSDVKGGFQAFLKKYEKPIPVYESIFDKSEEAIQVEKLSIDKFRELGGKINLLGDLRI